MTFKHLEDLRDKHKREEIWVLGRGPSLDDYPTGFFNDKISIAINYAFVAFPNCTYYHSFHAGPAEWVARNCPDKLSSCILGCIQGPGPEDKQRRNRYEQSGEAPVYARVRQGRSHSYEELSEFVERVINGETCELLNSSTTLRTAIQVAIVLGASKVTLVGCELQAKDGLMHAKRTWLNEAYEKWYFRKRGKWVKARFFPGCRMGLMWLVKICIPYGIEVIRYYYGKGYERIEIS